jgi:chromate transporter
MRTAGTSEKVNTDHEPLITYLFSSFLRLGLTAFGGPAMVAYIKGMAVTRHKWLGKEAFEDGVVLCQSIPGATAMQTAAYVGLRAKGIAGALSTFVGFGLPAFVLMLILSFLYAKYHAVPGVISLFNGLQAVVVAIVANATFSFGKSTFKSFKETVFAVAASVLLSAGISPFVVVLGAALAGVIFVTGSSAVPASPKIRYAFKQFSALLVIPLFLLAILYVMDSKLFKLAVLMMKIDLFAFGGGFASVPLMFHEIVDVRGWMDSKTFMDGIAVGQVTPGPIVITSTFAGYLLCGLPGAIIATIAIFTPSFLLVIAVTPVFDRLKASAYFTSATKGILASFVGLLFFVTVKFALAVPWDVPRGLLICAAFAALLKKVDILYVVLISAGVSLFIF